MSESFAIELGRLIHVLGGLRPGADVSAATRLLDVLIAADASARGPLAMSPEVDERFLPDALSAVAFDAQAAGVDLECFVEDVADVRRALSGP